MSEQPVPSAEAVEERERLGDNALAAERLNEALDHYQEINSLILRLVDVAMDVQTSRRLADVLNRTRAMLDARQELRPAAVRAADLLAEADAAAESGDLAHASHMSFRLGLLLEELDDRDGAESAYRQAVAFARHVDVGDPELFFAAFCCLIGFLGPSEESIALAAEMGTNLITSDEMYHPMRAAEAAYHWSVVELQFAEVTPNKVDHVIDGIVGPAIEMADFICLHEKGQALQRQVAGVLRTVGRDSEADQWQSEADKYEDWEWFMDPEIPGHVHLWDIRGDSFARVEVGE